MGNEMVSVGGQMTETSNGTVAVQQSRVMAMQIAKIQSAHNFPRDIMRSLAKIKNACMRPKLASVATYTYARGGTEITGPSIRLAEVLAQNFGNIDCGIKEVEQRDGESTVLAYATDLETNYHCEKEFQVKHVIFKKNGGAKRLIDPRDIYEKVANDGARRLRACILAVIPKDVVDEAVETCEETLKANCGEITKERLDALVEKFSEFEVTKEMIEKRIQRQLSSITPAQFIDLGKKYNALKEGIASVSDFFDKPTAADSPEAQGATGATGASGATGEPAKKDLKEALGVKKGKGKEKESVEGGDAEDDLFKDK